MGEIVNVRKPTFFLYCCVADDVSMMSRDADGGQKVKRPRFLLLNQHQNAFKLCAVRGCCKCSNQEKYKGFLYSESSHMGVDKKRGQKWIYNLQLKSGGAETNNAEFTAITS